MRCHLEAHGIDHFIQGDHLASMLPGPQIHGYNTRAVLVPAEFAQHAVNVLSSTIVYASANSATAQPYRWPAALRTTLECLLFGWFIPGEAGDQHVAEAAPVAPQQTFDPSIS